MSVKRLCLLAPLLAVLWSPPLLARGANRVSGTLLRTRRFLETYRIPDKELRIIQYVYDGRGRSRMKKRFDPSLRQMTYSIENERGTVEVEIDYLGAVHLRAKATTGGQASIAWWHTVVGPDGRVLGTGTTVALRIEPKRDPVELSRRILYLPKHKRRHAKVDLLGGALEPELLGSRGEKNRGGELRQEDDGVGAQ